MEVVDVGTRLRKKWPAAGVIDGEVVSVKSGRCTIEWADGKKRTMRLDLAARHVVADENASVAQSTPVRRPRDDRSADDAGSTTGVVTAVSESIAHDDTCSALFCGADDETSLMEKRLEDEESCRVEDPEALWREALTIVVQSKRERRPLVDKDAHDDGREALVDRALRCADEYMANCDVTLAESVRVALEASVLALRASTRCRTCVSDRLDACLETVRLGATYLGPRLAVADHDEAVAGRLEEVFGVVRDMMLDAHVLRDKHVTMACDAALRILGALGDAQAVDGLQDKRSKTPTKSTPLATQALGVVAAAFGRYSGHRPMLLNEAIALARCAQRPSYVIVDGAHYGGPAAVRLPSALAVLVVQHAVDDDSDVPTLAAAMRAAKGYCTALLARCKEAVEWRPAVKVLVDDVAGLLVVPDWPAAETLAHALATVLVAEVNAPLAKKKGAAEMVSFAIDCLATLAATLHRLRVMAEAEPLSIDLIATPKRPNTKRRKRVAARNDEAVSAGDERVLERRAALQQLVFNGVSARASTEPWMARARKFHVSRWYAALPVDAPDEVRRHVVERVSASPSRRCGEWDVVLAPRDLAPVARRVFLDSSTLAAGVASLTTALAGQLGREQASLRSRAVRALDEVVRADPSLMADDTIHTALASRFRDEAISVRQAAVELVGAHALASSWETYETYHDALLDRLADRGISVRKSVVRILRSALEANATHAVHTATLTRLIDRVTALDEEQTVKDLVLAVVRDAWFAAPPSDSEESKHKAKRAKVDNHHDDAASASPRRGLPSLDATTRQIVDVVSGAQNAEWASGVLEAALQSADAAKPPSPDGDDDGEEVVVVKAEASAAKTARLQHRVRAAIARAQVHVAALVEHLLRLDEVRAARAATDTNLAAASAMDLVATVSTLRALAKARPELVAPRLAVLAPYLRGDNGLDESDEGAVCAAVADATAACVTVVPKHDAASLVPRLVPDLVGVAHRFGATPVASAVRCLATIARSGADCAIDELARLASWYYDALRSSSVALVGRASLVLGLACRYFARGLASKIGSRFVAAAYVAIRDRFDNAAARVVVAIGNIVIGSPRFALEAQRDRTLQKMLSHPDDAVRAKALAAWTEVVAAADAADTDVSHVVGATQAYVPQMLASLRADAARTRAAALALAGAVLRAGMVNPLDVVSHVVAAVADPAAAVNFEASRVLATIDERYSHYLVARFVDGILDGLLRLSSNAALDALADAYARFIQPKHKNALSVLRRLAAALSADGTSDALITALASLLGRLPYASVDDALFVLFHVNRQACLVDEAHSATLDTLRSTLVKKFRLTEARIAAFAPKSA